MTSGDSTAARLRERLDRDSEPYPEAWMPGPGGELLGAFEGFRSGTTRRGETHSIALVRDEAGDLFAVWLFHMVLRAEFEKASPQPGEQLLIRRLPDRENADGQSYRVYRVVVDRDEELDPSANTLPPTEERKPPEGDWTFLGDGVH